MIDQIDHRIIALLRENARRSFKNIGDQVSLSAPAVKRRVDRLEREGVIKGYAAAVEPSAFGWHAHAFVELFCEGRMSGAEVRDAVMEHPEVEAAYTIAGAPSAIVHIRAVDNQHLEETLERIRETKGVLRTQTQIVLSTLLDRPVAETNANPAAARSEQASGAE